MESKISKILEQERGRLKTDPEGSVKNLVNPLIRIKKWTKFLSRFSKKDTILDFGCGGGFGLYAGKKLGLNITGIDIPGDHILAQLHEIFNVKPVFYSGYKLPFKSNKFDVLIFHWSICFNFEKVGSMTSTDIKKRCVELNRISKPGATWYIAPRQHIVAVSKLTNHKIVLFNIWK